MKTSGLDSKGASAIVILILLLAISVFLFVANGYRAEAVIGGAGNLGTEPKNKHNLSASATHGGIKAASEEQICIFCHTPHNAIQDASSIDPPLWNHSLSSATYDLSRIENTAYSNGIIPGSGHAADGASRLCLSCHDGTVAIGKVNSRTSDIQMSGACLDPDGSLSSGCTGYLGTTISSHHLFSIPMNDDLINDSITQCTGQGRIRVKYPWQTVGGYSSNQNVLLRPTLPSNQYNSQPGVQGNPANGLYSASYNYGVQCSSCHDPHTYRESGSTNCKFLVDGCTDNITPVCNACHSADCS